MSEEKQAFRLLDVDDSEGGLTAYALDEGEVADADLEPLWRRFDEAAVLGKKLRVYAEMHALPTFGRGLVVEKLKRFETIMSTVERMAIVGDAEWLAVYARNINPIIRPEIKHFAMANKDEALAWLRPPIVGPAVPVVP